MNNIFFDRTGKKKIKSPSRKVIKRISAYGIAIKDNKILFVKSAWKEELDLPGGKIEHGETLIEGLIREFHEETGYIIEPISKPSKNKPHLFYADDLDTYFNSIQYFFIVKILERDKFWKRNKHEITKVMWTNMMDIDKANLSKTYLVALKKILSSYKK